MGLFELRSYPARAYFVRSGRMFIIAGAVVAIAVAFGVPDAFGRVFGGVASAYLIIRGVLRVRKARAVSASATVEETMVGRTVGYTLHDDVAGPR